MVLLAPQMRLPSFWSGGRRSTPASAAGMWTGSSWSVGTPCGGVNRRVQPLASRLAPVHTALTQWIW